jgi:4-diphosphocytidyl-2-C-methyl-D-erythritol kinase
MSGQRLRARAKLTWSLRVVGVRGDGYHLIDAEMLTLDLADTVTVSAAAETSVTVSARVHVDKQIPSGGGLGGGSADAAAILRWAGDDGTRVAAALGADVPFCLAGGRARVTGIGEIVEPLPFVERTVTLVVPPLYVSTPAVYRAWDGLGGPTADGPNDLEPAAVLVEPRLEEWRQRVGELSGQIPTLAGSGSTWFVEGQRDDALGALGVEGATVVVCRAAP